MSGSLLARLWRGEHDLHDTFWRYTILYGLLVNVVTTIGFMALIAANMPAAAVIVGYAIPIPYNIFVVVAVWRSAGAYQGPISTAVFMRVTGILWMTVLSLV